MSQVEVIVGLWKLEANQWFFYRDPEFGSKFVTVREDHNLWVLSWEVCMKFEVSQRLYDVSLSYRRPSEEMRLLPLDTPPVYLFDRDDMVRVFVEKSRRFRLRLCAEFFEKSDPESEGEEETVVGEDHGQESAGENIQENGHGYGRFSEQSCRFSEQTCRFSEPSSRFTEQTRRFSEQTCRFSEQSSRFTEETSRFSEQTCRFSEQSCRTENEEAVEENGEDADGLSRFDYCDDPDGASSGDEEYTRFQDSENNSSTQKEVLCRDEFVGLELSAVELAVGQCYPTKEELETRLKILAVTRRFDYDILASTRYLLRVRCWVGGCQWKLRAGVTDCSSTCFYIKDYVERHTCSVTERSCRGRQASPYILARLYVDFVGGVGPSVLPSHVAECLTKRYGVKASVLSFVGF